MKESDYVRKIYGNYLLTDDKKKLQIDKIIRWLNDSYWASRRSEKVVEVSIVHSICYGIYEEDVQVGFARVVTDYATMYWLADVIIDENHRGKGLGKALMDFIGEDERINSLMGLLATKDAQGLYQKYGFMTDPEKLMKKPRNK